MENKENNKRKQDNKKIKKNKKEEKKQKINKKNKIEQKLLFELNKLNAVFYEKRIIELMEVMGNTKKFFIRNFTSGIVKGIGAGIGFSIITAVIIYLLQKIIKLNIPIISKYISDIIEIVKQTK